MSDLLKNEEIKECVLKIRNAYGNEMGFLRDLLQTQNAKTKKGLVEWLKAHNENRNCYSPEKLVYGLVLLNEDWQKIQKEVEDG